MCESDVDELCCHNRDEKWIFINCTCTYELCNFCFAYKSCQLKTVVQITVIRDEMSLLQNWCGRGVVVMRCVDVAEKMELLWCEDMNELLKWF